METEANKMTKQPSYRFVGYDGPWEQRKLGEISSRVKGNDGRMDLPTLTISAGQGWLDQRERFSGNIAGKEQKNYTLLRKGELSYNHGNSKLAKYGVVFQLNTYTEALVPKVYHSFKMIDGRSGTFFEYLFATKIPDRELGKLVSSGARMDGLLNITYDDFMSIKLTFPKNNEEQTAIGSFFQDIDQLISLQQRKLEVLKEQKKTYLKLLFPAKGQTKPALRFAGFEDEWQRQNFGDYLVEYNEKTVVENQHELLSSTNNGIEPRVGRVSGESNLGYKVLKKDMIVLSPQNLWLGNINYNSNYDLGIVSPSYKIFNIENVDKKFIATLIRHPYMNYEYGQASVQGASVVRRNLDIDLFNGIQIFLPSLEEQSLIGSFFQDLDKAIAKQEEKVNQLKESKQTLLRKMFI